MGTNECSQPASKSSQDSQDFGDVNMVLKMAHFHKSSRPQWVNSLMLGDADMHQQARLSLLQIMACHLVCTKPFSEPMLDCKLDP